MRKTTILNIIGFLMAGSGILSLILMLFGARLTYMRWLEFSGAEIGFALKLVVTLAGFMLIFLARVDWDKEVADTLKDTNTTTHAKDHFSH